MTAIGWDDDYNGGSYIPTKGPYILVEIPGGTTARSTRTVDRRCASSLFDVLAALPGVLFAIRKIRTDFFTRLSLFEQFDQEWSTPTAAGTCTKTLAQLAGPNWLFQPKVVHHFPFRNVKAEAEFVVQFHDLPDWVRPPFNVSYAFIFPAPKVHSEDWVTSRLPPRQDCPVASRKAMRHAST
jgi:hypothetical protein